MTNLFADIPAPRPAELVTTLFDTADVRLERIISNGHASPADFWYDQRVPLNLTENRGRNNAVRDGPFASPSTCG